MTDIRTLAFISIDIFKIRKKKIFETNFFPKFLVVFYYTEPQIFQGVPPEIFRGVSPEIFGGGVYRFLE